MRILFLILSIVVGACLLVGTATPVLADDCTSLNRITCAIQAGSEGGSSTINLNSSGTYGFSSVGQALNTIISVIFFGVGLAAFGFILWGAFNYLTAGEDSGKTDKARKMITNAIIGLILVALVYVIWIVVINFIPGMSKFFGGGGGGSTDGGATSDQQVCESIGGIWDGIACTQR